MRTATAMSALLAAAILLVSCGGGDPEAMGPRPGTAEWHWEGVIENFDSGNFAKALEHQNDVAGRDDPLAEKAVLWRTATLAGLSLGHLEAIDNFNDGITEKASLEADYANIIQQLERDGRQYAIELAESLGDVDKAMSGDSVSFEFPFPMGSPSPSPVMTAIAGGEGAPANQVSGAIEHTIRRGLIRAASEIGGFDPDQSNQAKAKYDAGPVSVPAPKARRTMAKMLLDISLLFSRERVNQPDIRKIFIERAESWAEPFAESEDEEEKEWAEQFAKEIEDERRDMERKARRVGARS